MQLLVRSPRRHPVLGREFGSIVITRITDAFSKVEVHDFRRFLGYVLTDGYNLDVGIVSFG